MQITIETSDRSYRTIDGMAAEKNMSLAQYIEQAVASYMVIDRKQREGYVVKLVKGDSVLHWPNGL